MAKPCTRNVPDNDQNRLCYPQKGLPAIPLELLLRIVSLMQGPAIPWYGGSPMWNEERERRECLRSFCQLCRSLRAALLPVLWERLEACTVLAEQSWGIIEFTDVIVARSRTLERELIGQLNLMINSTTPYAPYVRVVNVAIEARFSPTALSELARAMALMPNLHTIQIICNANMHCKTDQFQNTFKKHVYPSVRRASLPHQAAGILASFPEVVDVCINQALYEANFGEFLQAVAKNCPKIECFGWWPTLLTNTKMVPQRLPNLRRLDCCFVNPVTALDVNQLVEELATLKNLEEFTLTVQSYWEDMEPIPENLVMDAARKAFAGSSSPNKCLTVHYYDQTRVETFGAD